MSSPYEKTGTKMQGVHTLLAMPQWYINFNLMNLLQTGRTSSGGSLKNVQLTIGENTWLRGVVSSLSTKVYTEGSTRKIKLIVEFSSGEMDYYDVSKAPPVKESANIAGLIFGFEVDLNLRDLEANESLPPDVKQAVEKRVKNLGPGAFTIQQLFMDFQEAALSTYDPSITVFPKGMSASAQGYFPNYMRTYMAELRQAGGLVLGYSIKVGNPGGKPDIASTFAPTDLEFVTNRYRPSEVPNPSEYKPDLDTINYLMMTGGEKFPPSEDLLPWWGNYVTPADEDSGWYGTMAVARDLFVYNFLFKRLAPLVCHYWALSDAKGTTDPSHTEKIGEFTRTALGGSFSSGNQSSTSATGASWFDDFVVWGDKATYNFSVSVTLRVVPGQNKIIIERTTDFDAAMQRGLDRFRIWYSIPLTITITLAGVADGQLVVGVEKKTKEPEPKTVYADDYGWLITKTEGNWPIWLPTSGAFDRILSKIIKAAIPEGLLPKIEQTIRDNLNLSPFVFPGGRQLFMKSPIFNDAGDLLVGLQYKA